MSSANELRLCESAAVLDDAWRELYESAFPAGHKEPESKIAELIAAGKMLYHKTLDSSGQLLCFSLVSICSDFLYLPYLATSSKQRSAGVGSKHMKKLLELLKEQYKDSIGLVLEIDATGPKNITLSDEEKKIRNRRFQFYKRLGAKRACRTLHFLIPPRTAGGAEVELDVLYFNFKTSPPDLTIVRRVISEIYQRSYCLSLEDPLVVKVLAQFRSCTTSGCDGSNSRVCPVEEEENSTASSGTTPVAPVASSAQQSGDNASESLPVVKSDCDVVAERQKESTAASPAAVVTDCKHASGGESSTQAQTGAEPSAQTSSTPKPCCKANASSPPDNASPGDASAKPVAEIKPAEETKLVAETKPVAEAKPVAADSMGAASSVGAAAQTQ